MRSLRWLLGLPTGWQLAIGSRASLPLPPRGMRAQGSIVEVGADDLAMGKAEARSLLIGAGVDLAEPDLDVLIERTEGWPAGLYLAALAINAGGAHVDVAHTFTGDDRFMGDYLRTEFLDRVSRPTCPSSFDRRSSNASTARSATPPSDGRDRGTSSTGSSATTCS